jgi:hypothetical protein
MALFLPAPARDQIEDDLKLVAELGPDNYWNAGRYPNIRVKLVNTSATTTHRVVRPGAGSTEGFGEPHVYYTATFHAPVRPPVHLVSGQYDGSMWRCVPIPLNEWAENVLELPPGRELEIGGYGGPPVFDFPGPGKATIRAHYAYTGGERPAARMVADSMGLKRMAGVPAFELVSNPVEVEVTAPLEVRLRVKHVVKVGRTYPLSQVFEVTLANRGVENVEVHPPTTQGRGDWLHLWFDRPNGSARWCAAAAGLCKPMLSPAWDRVEAATIRPRESAILAGGPSVRVTPADEGYQAWTPSVAGFYRVRAGYTAERNRYGGVYSTSEFGTWDVTYVGTVKSEWVEVRVEP